MRGRAAEAAVIDQERHGQTEQGLDREEYSLPAGGDGAPEFELAELAACLADRQIQIASKFSHTVRLLPSVRRLKIPAQSCSTVAIMLLYRYATVSLTSYATE